jgi:endonuclease III
VTNKPAEVKEVIRRLEKAYPHARVGLQFSTPLEILVATILAAQSTDALINKLSPALFARYHTAADYAHANVGELESLIYSSGFYHNKAKNIIGAAQVMVDRFNGEVPRTMEEILTLPGVARKTANIVLYNAYGVVAGIPVDTHARRLSNRLRLSSENDPVKIERDLMAKVPRGKWGEFNYLLVDHGRAVCTARKPKHEICVLADICPSAFKI